MNRPVLVVTSISRPNAVLEALAEGASRTGFRFLVIGDMKSPSDFSLEGCEFYDVNRQCAMPFETARMVPLRHYARKNVGYLIAIAARAPFIVETDDDNFPRSGFWADRQANLNLPLVTVSGWVNVYRYFSESVIWPRGLPLDELHAIPPDLAAVPVGPAYCPIQQGLADANPDVDAIYRLAFPLPQNFRHDRRVALGTGSWCPFNSQNTTWWPETYPLLYLPAYCSFRMTDIWRSFVAQRIAWENDWSILFHEPTVWQERNEHNLMRDFADEVPGYLNNRAICTVLAELELLRGNDSIPENLRRCYKALVNGGWIPDAELALLEAWLHDLSHLPPC